MEELAGNILLELGFVKVSIIPTQLMYFLEDNCPVINSICIL